MATQPHPDPDPTITHEPGPRAVPQWAMLVHLHAALLDAYDALGTTLQAVAAGDATAIDQQALRKVRLTAFVALSRLPS